MKQNKVVQLLSHVILLVTSSRGENPSSFLKELQLVSDNPEESLKLCDTVEKPQELKDELQYLLRVGCDNEDAEFYKFQDPNTLVRSESKTKLCFKVKRLQGLKLVRVSSNFKDKTVPDGFTVLDYEYEVSVKAIFRDGQMHGPRFLHQGPDPIVSFSRIFNGQEYGKSWFFENHDQGKNPWYSWRASETTGKIGDLEILAVTPGGAEVVSGHYYKSWNRIFNASRHEGGVGEIMLGKCPLDLNVNFGPTPKMYDMKGKLWFDSKLSYSNCLVTESENSASLLTPAAKLKSWTRSLFSLNEDVLRKVSFYDEPLLDNAVPLYTNVKKLGHDNDAYSIEMDGNRQIDVKVLIKTKHSSEKPSGNAKMIFEVAQPLLFWKMVSLSGYMLNGFFHGPVIAGLEDGRFINLRVKDNVIHGIAALLGQYPLYVREDKLVKPESGFGVPGMGFAASIINGKIGNTKAWLGLVGSGFIYGPVDENGRPSGKDVIFIYPDFQTALVGTFEGGVMISAVEGEIAGVICLESGILEPRVQIIEDKRDVVYSYDPSSSEQISSQPLLRDPYESKRVEIRSSGIDSDGEGVFALRDFEEDEDVAFYQGYLFDTAEFAAFSSACHYNQSRSKAERRECTMYEVTISYFDGKLGFPLGTASRYNNNKRKFASHLVSRS